MVTSNSINEIYNALSKSGFNACLDEPLYKHTTYKIGGPADLFCTVNKIDQFINIVTICREAAIPIFILGSGSNILVSDKGFRGVVIQNKTGQISINDNVVTVDSGCIMPKIVRATTKKELTGGEFLQAIPGTLGGGVHENARFRRLETMGFYEGNKSHESVYIGELIRTVTIMEPNNHITEVGQEECGFVYDGTHQTRFRHSGEIILVAELQLRYGTPEQIRANIDACNSYRKSRIAKVNGKEVAQPIDTFTGTRTGQPEGLTAGCIFANVPNPYGHPTSRMIDLCGLKGTRIGGAYISTKHANYIVNDGNATAEDIAKLINLCKERVLKEFGVEIVEEIELVGEW